MHTVATQVPTTTGVEMVTTSTTTFPVALIGVHFVGHG